MSAVAFAESSASKPASARAAGEDSVARTAVVRDFPDAARTGARPESASRVPREGDGPLARLYRPAPVATQSAPAIHRPWVLEFEPQCRTEIEPLMGWTSSRDPLRQVRLTFPTKEAGLGFARRHGLRCVVIEPHERRIRPKSYAENFRWKPTE
ncbi:MAG: ETC complex I subunit [Alphaproteobacteria bacterium]